MRTTKTRIIKDQGENVTVQRLTPTGRTSYETKALIGRLNKQMTNMKQLENYKEGILRYFDEVDGGDIIECPTLSESYVVSSAYSEPFKNKVIAKIVVLLKCNHILNATRLEEVADHRGNVSTQPVSLFSAIPCYVEQVTSDLDQTDIGILPETEYLVYTTALPLMETDQLEITIKGKKKVFKITALDYITYPKMVVIQICQDIRK